MVVVIQEVVNQRRCDSNRVLFCITGVAVFDSVGSAKSCSFLFAVFATVLFRTRCCVLFYSVLVV